MWIILCIGFALLGQTKLEKKEQFLFNIEKQMDSLQVLRDHQVNQNTILASQIQQMQTGMQRSYREHRKLEKQLREAQSLNLRIKQTEMQIKKLNLLYQDSLKALINAYEDRLNELIILTENARSNQEREQYLRKSQTILMKKTRWAQRHTASSAPLLSEIPIHIQPWDNPASLELKRNALLDQEEAIRREMKTLDNKIDRLQEENNLRKKMAELNHDLNLFSENEETMDRLAFGGHTGNEQSLYDTKTWETVDTNTKPFFNEREDDTQFTPFLQKDFAADTDHGIALDIEDRILILKQYREKLAARSDSLKLRARWFEKQTEKLLKSDSM